MRTCRRTSTPDRAKLVAWVKNLSFFDIDFTQMHEDTHNSLPVIQTHNIAMDAKTRLLIADENDFAPSWGDYSRTKTTCIV